MSAALHVAAFSVSLLVGATALFTIIAMLKGNWSLILSALKGQGAGLIANHQISPLKEPFE